MVLWYRIESDDTLFKKNMVIWFWIIWIIIWLYADVILINFIASPRALGNELPTGHRDIPLTGRCS